MHFYPLPAPPLFLSVLVRYNEENLLKYWRSSVLSLETIINAHYEQLSDNDLFILRYITNHQQEITNLSISELSALVNSSTASILRLAKKLDFSGYSEFKYYLKQHTTTQVQQEEVAFYSLENLSFDIDQTMKAFKNDQYLTDLLALLDQLDTIYAFCVGYGQRLMLKEFARCMLEYKKNVIIISGYQEFEKLSQGMNENDLVFIISQIGETKELKNALQTLKVRGSQTVSITNLTNNELAKLTRWNFYYKNSNIDQETKMNRSSFLTLHLLLHMIFDSFTAYKFKKS